MSSYTFREIVEMGVALLFWGLLLVGAYFTSVGLYEWAFPEPETSSISSSLEDRCEFVVKTNGESFNISEPNAGTFKYELYATSDGYVEVWKCK